MTLDNVKDVLEQTLDILGLKRGIRKARAITCWPEVVGDEIANHAQAKSIKNGILFVTTSSPAWAQEMSLMKKRLIKKLNHHLGEVDVKDIKFSPRGISPAAEPGTHKTKEDLSRVKLTIVDSQKIDKIIEGLSDKKLEKKIRKVLVSDQKLKKLKRTKK